MDKGKFKLISVGEKIKQHKAAAAIVCLGVLAVIVFSIILATSKTYKIGQEIRGKYLSATVMSVEYTDNAAGQIKADDGYMFVIIEVLVTNKSRNEECVDFKNFVYQNEHSTFVSSYSHALSFNSCYVLFKYKRLLQSESIRGSIIYQVRKEISKHTLYFKEYDGANEEITSCKIILPNSNLG